MWGFHLSLEAKPTPLNKIQKNLIIKRNHIRSISTSTGAAAIPSIPCRTYEDFSVQREQILKENKGKSGIYRFINKVTGKSYIGSAVNLSDRLWDYSSQKFLDGQLKRPSGA